MVGRDLAASCLTLAVELHAPGVGNFAAVITARDTGKSMVCLAHPQAGAGARLGSLG